MKTLLILAFVAVLSGCATRGMPLYNPNPYQQQQAIDSNPVAQAVAQYGQLQPSVRVDHVCMQRCTKAGYQWGMCQKSCSY